MNLTKIKEGFSKSFPWILAVALLFFLTKSCSEHRQYVSATERNVNLLRNDSVNKVERIRTIEGEKKIWTYQKSAFEVTEEELRSQLWVKDRENKVLTEKFSKLDNYMKLSIATRIDTIKVPFEKEVPCDFAREETIYDDWYSMNIVTNQNGNVITDFSTNTDLTVVTGTTKKNIWSSSEIKIEVTPTNPFMTINKIEGQVVTVTKKWYEQLWLWFVGGGILGIISANAF